MNFSEVLIREFYHDYMTWKIAKFHYKDQSPAPTLLKPWMQVEWTQWAKKIEPIIIQEVIREVDRTYKIL